MIVIKLPLHSNRSRSRAMQIAAAADGKSLILFSFRSIDWFSSCLCVRSSVYGFWSQVGFFHGIAGTVTSVRIQGTDRDHLVVTGDGIDSVNLTQSLRKKFGDASIVSVRAITSSPERSTGNIRYDYGPYGSSSNQYGCGPYGAIDNYQQRHQWPSSSHCTNYPRESYMDEYDHSNRQGNCAIMWESWKCEFVHEMFLSPRRFVFVCDWTS